MGCHCLPAKTESLANSNDFNIDNATKFDSKKPSETDSKNHHYKQINIDEREFQIPPNPNNISYVPNDKNDPLQLLRYALYKEINTARNTPWFYIDKIKQFKQRIFIKDKLPFLKIDDTVNITLRKGENAFDNCINFLSQKTTMPPFILLDELSLPFPGNKPEVCVNQEYLMKILTEKSVEMKESFIEIDNFHYDKSVGDHEISTIMQIVDDTNANYQRRKNIFSSTAKYIGITCGLIEDNVYCFYLIFGKEKEKTMMKGKDRKK